MASMGCRVDLPQELGLLFSSVMIFCRMFACSWTYINTPVSAIIIIVILMFLMNFIKCLLFLGRNSGGSLSELIIINYVVCTSELLIVKSISRLVVISDVAV